MPNDLARYDAMCRAIEEAHSIDEVVLIKDKARAIEAAAKIARNVEAETKSRIIRFRAERRLGELIKPLTCSRGYNKGNIKGIKNLSKEIGISENSLRIFKIMSEIPKDEFEERIRTKQSSVNVIGYKNLGEFQNRSEQSFEKSNTQLKYIFKLKHNFANASKATQHNFIRWLVDEGHITHEILDNIYDCNYIDAKRGESANA